MKAFTTDEQRWHAIVTRDPAADGQFCYGVLTTGVYCRNVCPARQALRKNVRFFATCAAAEQAGLRPCKRCQPTGPSLNERQAHWVAAACRQIEASDTAPSLAQLAAAAGVSGFHFQRVFKAQTGITPKAYAQAIHAQRTRYELTQSKSVTAALHSAGYQSSSRFYENATALLGMEPKRFQAGGAQTTIWFAIGQCWLGAILVAATERGVCMISLDDDPELLARELQDRFPQAELLGGDAAFETWVAQVIGGVESPQLGITLPLDLRGTAFQQRVWQALREIPAGETTSYTQLAARLGQPKAVRAVASACAANSLAVAIPCHRVVRTDGSLTGYRWGVERKRQLIEREKSRE